MSWVIDLWNWLPEVIRILIKIVAIVLPLMLMVAYYTLLERKVISYMQVRIGPNRVGFKGSLQPIADALKLMFKEIVLPSKANKFLFLLAPMLTLGPRLLPGPSSPSTRVSFSLTSMQACSTSLR